MFLRAQSAAMAQTVFNAPSVFNFYPPDYVVPRHDVLGPEFALQNTTTAFARINFANSLVYSRRSIRDQTVYGATGTQPDWSALTALAGDPEALVDKLDRLLLHGTMSPARASAIVTAINAVPQPTRWAARRRPSTSSQPRRNIKWSADHGPPRIPSPRRARLSAAGLGCATSIFFSLYRRTRRPSATTRRWSACSCSAASTATTSSSRRTRRATAHYAAVRGASSGIQLTQAELLPIAPRDAIAYALRSASRAHRVAGAVQRRASSRFSRTSGTLTQPTSKAQYYAAGRRPDNLFSHSDQQTQWQTAVATGASRTGWGGRLADAIGPVAGQSFPGDHLHRGRHAVM